MGDITDENRSNTMIQQEYAEFLERLEDTNAEGGGETVDSIKEMINNKKQRLLVNINDLREANLERCISLLKNGFQEMPLFERALRDVVSQADSDYATKHDEFFIGLEGSFGGNHVTPRTLTSLYLGHTVCIEGIVTKCSLINPKVVRSFHYCPTTKKTSERRYADVSSFDAIPTANVYPTKDDEGNLLETEFGLSKYRDHQTITIQEMPEKAPTGQLPRALDVVLDNDLVDLCKPGDRVLVVGVFRCLAGKQGGYTTGTFRSLLLASNVTVMHKDINAGISSEDDLSIIRRFARTPNVFNILARSLAPSIHGHEYIKKALLCLLLGGVEKTLANGTRLRGDINVLLIGDPSVAKSQMLRYAANVAPRVVMTTGRGSSGVGLTAAVTSDHETGERRLEAGAMVLADRGIVCIDEFDKMSDADRTAIHEVMEQGKVTIAKAGIHARLNARTSVLAAANPLYGRYDSSKTPMENIGLQDSLLSRFDLLFILKDVANPDADRLIADHVLRMHRYRNPTEQDGEPTPFMQNDMLLATGDPEQQKKVYKRLEPYERHDPLLHGKLRTRGDKVLSMEFIKKYIAAAKTILPAPQMTSEASKLIAEEYTRLRSANLDDSHVARTQPITARSLETMIRLAAAHAKSRFSVRVTKEDAKMAIELIQYAIFERVDEKEKKKRKANEDDGSGGEEDMEEGDENGGEQHGENGEAHDGFENGGMNPPKRIRPSNGEEDSAVQDEPEKMDESVDGDNQVVGLEPGEITDERYERFKSRVSQLFEMEREQSLGIQKILEWMIDPRQGFSRSEVFGGLNRLSEENVVIVAQGLIFLAT